MSQDSFVAYVLSRALAVLSPLKQRNVAQRYAIAISAGLVAVLLRWCLDPVLGHVAFYATVYMAVTYCAVVCGWTPAVWTALIGFLGIFYCFVDPRYSLGIARSEVHGVIGFFLVSAVLIWLGEANRRKQLRLNAAVVALTAETNERKRAEEAIRHAHDELEQRVQDRTAQLSRALSELESEVEIRRETEERLRALSVRLMSLQDEERRRIARDLHDTTGQTFAAMKMTLAALQRAAANIPGISRLVDDLNALADGASQEIRTTSYLLHPPLLDEAGIASAARWFVEGFAKRSGIQVECEVSEKLERPNRNCELVLFRVLQESLTNVHRYSRASEASVRLWKENAQLNFEISDNGGGIPEERLRQIHKRGASVGVGIVGMRERVHELGGQFEIRSGRSGTTVSVALPMSRVAVETENGVDAYAV